MTLHLGKRNRRQLGWLRRGTSQASYFWTCTICIDWCRNFCCPGFLPFTQARSNLPMMWISFSHSVYVSVLVTLSFHFLFPTTSHARSNLSQQILRGGLGVFFGIGFQDIFTYFEDDLDKVLTLFVPLLRRWYADDSVAFKVCACFHWQLHCHACFHLEALFALFFHRLLVWLPLMLCVLLVSMGSALLSTNSMLELVTRLKARVQTRWIFAPFFIFHRYFPASIPDNYFEGDHISVFSIRSVLRIFGSIRLKISSLFIN